MHKVKFTHNAEKKRGESSLLDNAIENGYNDSDWKSQRCDESGVRHKELGNVTAEKRMLVVGKCAWSCYSRLHMTALPICEIYYVNKLTENMQSGSEYSEPLFFFDLTFYLMV